MDLSKRDLFSDFLRAFSLAVVVIGHWLELITSHLKPLVRWTEWLTWGFQVLPIFFMVGGSLNAASWSRSLERGESWTIWIRRRAQRLLMPMTPLLVVWLIMIPLLALLGFPEDFIKSAALTAVVPLWFLGAYLAVVVFTPVTLALHRKYGAKVVLAFAAVAIVADGFVHLGYAYVGDINILLVWGGIHQLGYFWQDKYLGGSRAKGIAVAATAIVALLLLVRYLGYPISMVVVDSSELNNAAPPSFALFLLGLAQVTLCLAVRPAVTRWLQDKKVQMVVGGVGRLTMTVFLWHMTAILLVAALAWATGNWPEAPDIDGSRWAVKPFWLLLIGVVLAGLVFVFRRIEDWPTDEHRHTSRRRALVGVALCLAGIAWVGLHGLDPTNVGRGISGAMIVVLFAGMFALDALPNGPKEKQGATRSA